MTHPPHLVGNHEDERRSLERRVFELERQMAKVMTMVAITEVKVDGLVETFKSRFVAFDRGQEMILQKLGPLDAWKTDLPQFEQRLLMLESVKQRAEGMIWMVRTLGVTGIIGGVIAIIRMISSR